MTRQKIYIRNTGTLKFRFEFKIWSYIHFSTFNTYSADVDLFIVPKLRHTIDEAKVRVDRQTAVTDASEFIICPMVSYSNGTDYCTFPMSENMQM